MSAWTDSEKPPETIWCGIVHCAKCDDARCTDSGPHAITAFRWGEQSCSWHRENAARYERAALVHALRSQIAAHASDIREAVEAERDACIGVLEACAAFVPTSAIKAIRDRMDAGGDFQ